MHIKKIFVGIIMTICTCIVIAVFYWQEWQYTQPTTIPDNHVEVALNQKISLPAIATQKIADEPVFIHFFNPECPCSVFNAKHFREIHQEYNTKIEFLVVIPEESNRGKAAKILPEGIKIVHDTDKAIANSCGIYSSPQAVIIDNMEIYFKGNYNKARYCTTKDTNYAALALEKFLDNAPIPLMDAYATVPYGCGFKKSNSLSIFNF